jgi:large subunit ribosomal protein L21
MYAIIADGGRQYRVEEDMVLDVDFRDVEQGATISFDKVLLVSGDAAAGVRLGEPVVAGVTVTAEVMGAKMGEKLVIQKYRRRKNYRRKTGHRQLYTRVRITGIKG